MREVPDAERLGRHLAAAPAADKSAWKVTGVSWKCLCEGAKKLFCRIICCVLCLAVLRGGNLKGWHVKGGGWGGAGGSD